MRKIAALIILVLTLTLVEANAELTISQVIEGTVFSVYDGDTLTVKTHNGEKIKVRLYGIDAPEKAQPLGGRSHLMLFDQAKGQDVVLYIIDKDRYQRYVAGVVINGRIINLDIVEEGLAECYIEYSEDPFTSKCLELQDNAKSQKFGVWSLPYYERPSDFRRRTN